MTGRRAAFAALLLVFLLGLAVNALDLSRPADPESARPGDPAPQVFRDYRDTAYWPVRDLVAGNNPYDVDAYLERRPGLQEFGLYLPAWLLLSLPFAVLPYDLSKFAYLGLLLVLAAVFGWAIVRASGRSAPVPVVLGVVGAVLLCAPGQATLYLGQATFQVAIGAVVAVHLAGRRPWLAGVGVAIALLKPQIGVPLVLLLLAWRLWRPVLAGLVVAGLASLVPLTAAVAGAGGVGPFADSVRENADYSAARYDDVDGRGSGRVDLPATIGKLTGADAGTGRQLVTMAVVVAVAVPALAGLGRPGRDGPAHPLAVTLVATGVLVATPHFGYDLLLAAWPLAALLAGSRRHDPPLTTPLRAVLVALLLVPLLHVSRVESALDAAGVPADVRSAMDGLAVAAAFAVAAVAAVAALVQSAGGGEGRPPVVARSTAEPRWNSSSK
jgi:Glycosyltransferase family 87